MEWRVIAMETMDAARAMALEEALLESVAAGGVPTLRFWRWEPSAATVGRFQATEREVDLQLCRELGVDVVRRMSGGGAVYHGKGQEFVFSITAPVGLFPQDLPRTYAVVLGHVQEGLRVMGIDTWLKDSNNLMVGQRKISGSSQRRSRGSLQLHGTVLYEVDEETMFSVLRARPGYDEGLGRATASRHHRVTGVSAHSGALYGEAYRIVRQSFLRGRSHREDGWSEWELARAGELVGAKYAKDDWNLAL
jgi:lipoate-protein ligase A